jgi:PAS domain S-box-containing protein
MKTSLTTYFLALVLVLSSITTGYARDGLRKSVLVGGDDNYPPYEYLDEQGRPAGFNIDIIRAVTKVMGLDANLMLGPWNQVRQDLEQGRLEAISGMYYSEERDRLVDFSTPHILVSYAVFVRNNSHIKKLEDIADQRIIVQRGDMGDDYVTGRMPDASIVRVENPAAALRLLASGQQDCAVLPRLLGLHLVTQFGLDNLKTAGSPFLTRKYCFAVREGDQELLGLLNEGLGIIKNTGEYDRIYNKWFGPYEERSTWISFVKYALLILAPLLALLALFIGWSWSLRRTVAAKTRELVCELAERRRAEAALRESEEKYRSLVEQANDAIFIVQDDTIKFHNSKSLEMTGYTAEEFTRTPFVNFIHPDDAALVLERYERRLRGEAIPSTYSFRIINKSGQIIWVQLNAALITWEGRPAVISFLRDVSEQRRLEAQLQQSQKMEAIGTLAGGIAHDFNNLLQAITGYTELLLIDKIENDQDYHELTAIKSAGQRASQLVRQLLTYSRKVETEKRPVDLNREVQKVAEIFSRTFPKMIDIRLRLAPDLWPVNADSNQLEQTLMNLGANARDAMPDGGQLVMTTQNVTVAADSFDHHGESGPVDYVLLTVSDTGHGMDRDTQDHIFDPFFTTKEIGRGTGLGLASVYGIVKNHNGHIVCESQTGRGATFSIYLPAIHRNSETEVEKISPAPPPAGAEIVLLVDDEESIRKMAHQMLSRYGYQVLSAATGEEALEMIAKPTRPIDLVVLDLGMPGMGGLKCLMEILKIDPQLKVVIASGYSEDGTVQDALDSGAAGFIPKPYQLTDFLQTVRRVLNQPRD